MSMTNPGNRSLFFSLAPLSPSLFPPPYLHRPVYALSLHLCRFSAFCRSPFLVPLLHRLSPPLSKEQQAASAGGLVHGAIGARPLCAPFNPRHVATNSAREA